MGTKFIPGILAYPIFAIILGCLLIIFLIRRKKPRFKRPLSYSLPIHVNLEDCILITSDFSSQGIDFSEITPLGTYSDFNSYQISLTDRQSSNPLYVKFQNDNKLYFAGPIYKDEISVLALFMVKRETCIYLDEFRGKYYFDLEFLYDNEKH